MAERKWPPDKLNNNDKRVRFKPNHEMVTIVEVEEEEEEGENRELVPYRDEPTKYEVERELWFKLDRIWAAMGELQKCDSEELQWIRTHAKVRQKRSYSTTYGSRNAVEILTNRYSLRPSPPLATVTSSTAISRRSWPCLRRPWIGR